MIGDYNIFNTMGAYSRKGAYSRGGGLIDFSLKNKGA